MCRHLAYLGPPRTLHSLVYEPPYSLEHQAFAPRMSANCLINGDGYGVAWYADSVPLVEGRPPTPPEHYPVRFRRAQPIWTDLSFAEVARVVASGCVIAAVRSATQGFPVDESSAQPFRDGRTAFSHNGKIEGFGGVEAKLRELAGGLSEVPDARAPVDSALLFALAVRAWRSGAGLAEGLAGVVATVTALTGGRYNLLAADGSALAATTWGDTLFVREFGEFHELPGAVVIASEPYDDEPGWRAVPDRSLVTADPSGVTIRPL